MGGGGSEIRFYFIEDYVLLTFYNFLISWGYDEEVGDLIINSKEELRCEFIFRK